jgi:hypothetical protein
MKIDDPAARLGEEGGCCGDPATSNASACYAADETVKKAGAAGCGCS